MADIQVFVDIEEAMAGLLAATFLPVVEDQLKGTGNDPNQIARALDGLNLGPAAQEIRRPLELLATNALLLGAAQFTERREVRLTRFMETAAIPPEVEMAVDLLVQGIDGSANELIRQEGQRALQEAEAEEASSPVTGTSSKLRLFKQFGGLAGKINAAVRSGTRVQSSIGANLTTSRMVGFGALTQATAGGIKTYQWNAQLDSKTCPFCTGMHGKVFSVGPNLDALTTILRSGDPEVAKAMSPWPQQTIANLNRLAGLSNSKLQEERFSMPPAHPRCRCVASIIGTVPRSEIRGFLRIKPGQGSVREQLGRHRAPQRARLAPEVEPVPVPEGLVVDVGDLGEVPANLVSTSDEISAGIRGPKATQSIDDLDDLFAQAAEADPVLRRITAELADELGGEAIFPPGIKGRARVIEKANAKYDGNFAAITDFSRATLQFDDLESVYRSLDALERRGIKIVRLDDRFAKPLDSGYRDIILGVEMPNGHVGELQLHVRGILAVKEENHLLYEEARSIVAKARAANRKMTAKELVRVNELNNQQRVSYETAFVEALGGF